MQLTELIAAQQKLKSERDVAIQQSKMAEERAGRMERQLKELKVLHSEQLCTHTCMHSPSVAQYSAVISA